MVMSLLTAVVLMSLLTAVVLNLLTVVVVLNLLSALALTAGKLFFSSYKILSLRYCDLAYFYCFPFCECYCAIIM